MNRRYLFGNALNPFKFPELAALERDVVAMTGDALRTSRDGGGGTMTSGGTESILMSMLVNRERARARGVERPQILAPVSAHPAYAKAAHYFDMDVVRVPLDADYRADVARRGAARHAGDRGRRRVRVQLSVRRDGSRSPTSPRSPLRTASAATSTRASAGSCCRSSSGSVTTCRPGTSGSTGVTEISADVHKYGYARRARR